MRRRPLLRRLRRTRRPGAASATACRTRDGAPSPPRLIQRHTRHPHLPARPAAARRSSPTQTRLPTHAAASSHAFHIRPPRALRCAASARARADLPPSLAGTSLPPSSTPSVRGHPPPATTPRPERGGPRRSGCRAPKDWDYRRDRTRTVGAALRTALAARSSQTNRCPPYRPFLVVSTARWSTTSY